MRSLFVASLCACTSITGGGGGTDPVGSGGGSAAAEKKGGFAASLNAELGKDGSGSAVAPAVGSADAGSATGSAAAPAAGSGSAAVVVAPPEVGSASTGAGTKAPDPKSAEFGGKNDGNHNAVPEPIASTEPAPPKPSANRAHVDPGPALAAIKMDMEPNWDRDYETAGTISFVLKLPNSNETRVFVFHYGYDLQGAPSDHEAYKKFLADQKVLNVTLDRQRGSAWYMEGTDDKGNPAWREEVTYGGKRLVCYGSQYKDRESTSFGPDLRDKVVNTAKKICETLTQ